MASPSDEKHPDTKTLPNQLGKKFFCVYEGYVCLKGLSQDRQKAFVTGWNDGIKKAVPIENLRVAAQGR